MCTIPSVYDIRIHMIHNNEGHHHTTCMIMNVYHNIHLGPWHGKYQQIMPVPGIVQRFQKPGASEVESPYQDVQWLFLIKYY